MKLEENRLFDKRYLLLKQLGQGASAQVWLASDTTASNMYVAIKVLSARSGIDTYGMQNFRREFTTVYNVQHQNLLTPTNYAVCDGTPYLVLPYCDNGSVSSMVGRSDENDVIKFLHDVAAGLECLHAHNIIHQDIKPDNILLDDDCNFLVTDFGISVGISDDVSGSYSGTRAYMAPERFGENKDAVKANDIWALGATAYEMITGDVPFGDNGGLVQTQGEALPELPATLQPELRDLIARCLNEDPWERPSAEDIRRKTARYLETGSWKERGGKKYLYISIAAAIAILVIAGAWIWDYNRTKVYYYKDYAEYWGVPKGIGVLTGSDMQHREQLYRFEISKRKVQRVSLINSVGNVIAHSDTEHIRSRYCDVRFFYSDNGSIDYKTIYDTNGKVLYKMDYDEKLKTVTFRQDDEYSTEFALDANTTKLLNQNASIFDDKSRISRYLLKHDEDGLLTEIRYVGLQNVPAGDSDNIYGMQYAYDSKGRKIEERFIGIDGSVKGNEFGLAIKEFEYDENDDWISVTYLNADRKASHDGNNCPLVKLENDEYGNRTKETYHTLDGTPSIRTDMSVHGLSYKISENGFRTERTCLGLNGQPGFSKNGYVTVKNEH
ncbi:MAG: serine/threonine protein kinase, partial [Muribaculaceae bacterium]|nr:serine/threonine protein kinase [Muribaculaceae bacterium]